MTRAAKGRLPPALETTATPTSLTTSETARRAMGRSSRPLVSSRGRPSASEGGERTDWPHTYAQARVVALNESHLQLFAIRWNRRVFNNSRTSWLPTVTLD